MVWHSVCWRKGEDQTVFKVPSNKLFQGSVIHQAMALHPLSAHPVLSLPSPAPTHLVMRNSDMILQQFSCTRALHHSHSLTLRGLLQGLLGRASSQSSVIAEDSFSF